MYRAVRHQTTALACVSRDVRRSSTEMLNSSSFLTPACRVEPYPRACASVRVFNAALVVCSSERAYFCFLLSAQEHFHDIACGSWKELRPPCIVPLVLLRGADLVECIARKTTPPRSRSRTEDVTFLRLPVPALSLSVSFLPSSQVKNKGAASVQITAEQLMREAQERQLEVVAPPSRQRIDDPEE